MSAELEALKEALRKTPTEEARREAAAAMRRYLAAHPGKRSQPTLVSLGYKKPYPTAVPVDKIPEELEKSPAFFEHFRKVIEED